MRAVDLRGPDELDGTPGTGHTRLWVRNPWGTDGPSADSHNDGYVTLNITRMLASCAAIQYGHA